MTVSETRTECPRCGSTSPSRALGGCFHLWHADPELRAEPSRGAHTPGPWRVGPYYKHEVVSDSGVITCAPIETEQTRANARLIAQSPALLAENEKLRAGHVVLLEALKAMTAICKHASDQILGLPGYGGRTARENIYRAEEAIQQAERT